MRIAHVDIGFRATIGVRSTVLHDSAGEAPAGSGRSP